MTLTPSTLAEVLPLTLDAVHERTVGQLHIANLNPHVRGMLSVQFIPNNKEKLQDSELVKKPQQIKLQQLLSAVPTDLPLRTIKSGLSASHGMPESICKNLTHMMICLPDGQLPADPIGFILIHEARMLLKVERALEALGHRGQHPHIPRALGLLTLTLNEIPENEGQERVYGVVESLPYEETLYSRGVRWKELGDASAGLSEAQRQSILGGICQAILDLHSMQMAYNEISPRTIGLTADLTPILTCFHSCAKFGTDLKTPATTSIHTLAILKFAFATSKKENDDVGMQNLEKWLHDTFTVEHFARAA